MIVHSENEMIQFGRDFAKKIQPPVTIELIGDVGAGKTTFTRGLAAGLGIAEPVTSPSFTISKRYVIPAKSNSAPSELIHYDFYRLPDPGIMRDELLESVNNSNNIVVIEWGNSVSDVLPEQTVHLEFSLNEDGSRNIKISPERFA